MKKVTEAIFNFTGIRKREIKLSIILFVLTWCLYAATTTPGTVYGDPSEYQFIPAIWGIAHPPGYAFYTLLAGIWQRLIPIGSVAYRTNLLAGASAAWSVSRVVLMIYSILNKSTELHHTAKTLVTLLTATAFAVSPDVWQHAIHANAHIVSLALTTTQLWLLMKWADQKNDTWLYTFSFFCGIGVTHHPITIWGLPAYAIYILLKQPKIIRQLKRIIPFVIAGALGLVPLLYYVLRSPNVPFGPTDMRTWSGFVRHTTAQGLRVNLFHYGLSDQFERWSVFISLLKLQYAIPFLLSAILGIYTVIQKKIYEGFLVIIFMFGHLAFTLNSVQDVMAYLLHAFMALVIPMAIGFVTVLIWWRDRSSRLGYALTIVATYLLVIVQITTTYPLITMKDWRDADHTFFDLVKRFSNRGENVTYVSDWEHLTPYYYHTLVEGVTIYENDILPVYVTSGLPWEEAVFANLPVGPVYLSNYRREIRNLGFRLRPVGDLWQVLEPPALDPVDPQYILPSAELDIGIQILGYDFPTKNVVPGDVVPLTLYATTPKTLVDIVMPYVSYGSINQRWTTDSRRLTPEWLPGEIIVEKYHIYIPHTIESGSYPVFLHYANLSKDNANLEFHNGKSNVYLGEINVLRSRGTPQLKSVIENSLTIIGNDISLISARSRVGLQFRKGIWTKPLAIKQADVIHLNLDWYALKRPQMSYTVFIHLIDANGIPHYGFDYTPLGGAFPTYLWFPKWLPGQHVNDPYKLEIPPEIAPGTYWLEVGMYEMGSIRRIPLLDQSGSMVGDRLILGPVTIASTDN